VKPTTVQDKLIVSQLVKKVSSCMETKGLLPFSSEPRIYLSPEQEISSQYPLTLFLRLIFNIILPSLPFSATDFILKQVTYS
jgi:hypothetical protein